MMSAIPTIAPGVMSSSRYSNGSRNTDKIEKNGTANVLWKISILMLPIELNPETASSSLCHSPSQRGPKPSRAWAMMRGR